MIYFSNFFADKKLRKIAHIETHTSAQMTHGETSKLVSRNVPKVEIFGTSKLSSLRCPESQLLDISGHVRKKSETSDFWRFPENLRNPQKSTKSQKSHIFAKILKSGTFWHFGCYPTYLARNPKICQNRGFGGFGQKPENWSGHQKMSIFEVPKKCKKMRKFPEFLTPKKCEKKCWEPRERRVANRGEFRPARSKKWHFFGHF